MSYVKHILQPGEQVLVVGKLHWIIYLPAICLLLCAAIAAGATAYFQNGDYQWPALTLCIVLLVFGLIATLRIWFKSFTTEIAVTTARVVHKTGFINRHTSEMNMDKIVLVAVDQSILGRILDYGTISIEGAVPIQAFRKLKTISHAIELRNAITSR